MASTLEQGELSDFRDFVLTLFQATGALVEVGEGGLVDVLLPDDLEEKLRSSTDNGLLHLTFDQRAAAIHRQAHYLAMGSPLADRLIELGQEVGPTVHLYVNGLKWSAQRAIRLEQWRATFANARFTPSGVEMAFASHYVLFGFRVSYITDEKREELRTVAVDSLTLQAAARGLLESTRLSPHRESHVSGSDQLPTAERLATVYARAAQVLEQRIADQMDHYRRRAARHLEVETLRINSFYDDTADELRRRLARAEDERRQALEMKIEANTLEHNRKLADVWAKHRLRVVLTPLSAAIITQTKVRTNVRVENRYASVNLEVVFDPLANVLELPTCQVCHEPAAVVHLCANGHIACSRCIRTCDFCKREYCSTCGVGACFVCGRALCQHSQIVCPECGHTVCIGCQGQCHGQGTKAAGQGRPPH